MLRHYSGIMGNFDYKEIKTIFNDAADTCESVEETAWCERSEIRFRLC